LASILPSALNAKFFNISGSCGRSKIGETRTHCHPWMF
jgi:hypothetical protein